MASFLFLSSFFCNLIFIILLRCLFVQRKARGKTFGGGMAASKVAVSISRTRAGLASVPRSHPSLPVFSATQRSLQPTRGSQWKARSSNQSSAWSVGLGLLHPWADRVVGPYVPRKARSERKPSARQQRCGGAGPHTNQREPSGSFLDIPARGRNKKDEHIFPICVFKKRSSLSSLQASHRQSLPLLQLQRRQRPRLAPGITVCGGDVTWAPPHWDSTMAKPELLLPPGWWR